MKATAFFIFLSVFLLAGCYLGDRNSLVRIMSLSFRESPSPTGVNLSATNAQVQAALEIIDAVLSTNGFVRDERPDMVNVPGFVVAYAHYDKPGLRLATLPDVYVRRNHLDVEIVELGNRTGHPTALTAKICTSLRKELSSRYGRESVKIHD